MLGFRSRGARHHDAVDAEGRPPDAIITSTRETTYDPSRRFFFFEDFFSFFFDDGTGVSSS